ncbi:hypothetical protein RJ639_042493 [Escallonia herrerae]|uniref:RNase H type-1 domain-containing protein n=1 Tax=Escallonia herrerae TaxID=1293975 RepID=A0AA89B1P1_9ASTE|nr:hypothetical protein RJ639_042493 [Escallonia herrerae]
MRLDFLASKAVHLRHCSSAKIAEALAAVGEALDPASKLQMTRVSFERDSLGVISLINNNTPTSPDIKVQWLGKSPGAKLLGSFIPGLVAQKQNRIVTRCDSEGESRETARLKDQKGGRSKIRSAESRCGLGNLHAASPSR